MWQAMSYAIAVAAVLGAVGLCVDYLLARRGLPRRWAWVFALLASMLLPVLMMSRGQPAAAPVAIVTGAEIPPVIHEAPAMPSTPVESIRAATTPPRPLATMRQHATDRTTARPPAPAPQPELHEAPTRQHAARWMPSPPPDRFLLIAWLLASSALLLYFGVATALLHSRAARWERGTVMGQPVLVSPDTGPALLGVVSPTIVVPRWYLAESRDIQALVLRHEQQHVAAHDALLSWSAMLLVAAMPWNLPLWWQLRRLRLAIELDCDARVVRAGTDAGAYGEVLLAVARRAVAQGGVAIAMVRSSTLERRIASLARTPVRHAALWTAGAVSACIAGAAAAAMINPPALPVLVASRSTLAPSSITVPSAVLRAAGEATGRAANAEIAAAGAKTAAAIPVAAMSAPKAPPVEPQASARPSAAAPATNADPLACLDPHVFRGLLLMPASQDFRISLQVPPELAWFKPPRELTWLGSSARSTDIVVNGAPSKTAAIAAVYRTSLAPASARGLVADALKSTGWAPKESPGMPPPVFLSANARPVTETYCRANAAIRLTASSLDGVTYVSLSTNQVSAGFTNECNRPSPPMQSAANGAGIFDADLPALELPRDAATGRTVLGREGGSSGNNGSASRSSSASFTLKDSAANVARHFADQIARQGWSVDASWAGAGSAGSTWSRQLRDGVAARGELMVVAFEGDRFTASFSATATK